MRTTIETLKLVLKIEQEHLDGIDKGQGRIDWKEDHAIQWTRVDNLETIIDTLDNQYNVLLAVVEEN